MGRSKSADSRSDFLNIHLFLNEYPTKAWNKYRLDKYYSILQAASYLQMSKEIVSFENNFKNVW